ncbi:MAG: hypothetical protein ABI239_08875 [Aquihabitans sp.]
MTSVARPLRPAPVRPVSVPTDLHVVRRSRQRAQTRRVRPAMVLAIGVIVVFGALLASVAIRSMLVAGQENLDQTRVQVRTEQKQLQTDRVELATQQSPERIAARAQALGMVATADQRWVSLAPSTTPTIDPIPEATERSNELAIARP